MTSPRALEQAKRTPIEAGRTFISEVRTGFRGEIATKAGKALQRTGERLSLIPPSLDHAKVMETTGRDREFLRTVLATDLDSLLEQALSAHSIEVVVRTLGLQLPLLSQGTKPEEYDDASRRYLGDHGQTLIAPHSARKNMGQDRALYQGHYERFGRIPLGKNKSKEAGYNDVVYSKIGEAEPGETVRLEVSVKPKEIMIIKYFWLLSDPNDPNSQRVRYKQIYHLAHLDGQARPMSSEENYLVSRAEPQIITTDLEQPEYSIIFQLANLVTDTENRASIGDAQDRIVRKSAPFHEPARRFEIVRKHRSGIITNGATLNGQPIRTGFDGYYVGRQNAEGQPLSPNEIIIAMANDGYQLLLDIKAECAEKNIDYDRVIVPTLDHHWMGAIDKKDVLKALQMLEKHFMKYIGRMREQGADNPQFNAYRAETQKMAEALAVRHLNRDNEGNWEIESLIGTPADVKPRPIDHILNDTQKAGIDLLMKIGIVGNDFVRATMAIDKEYATSRPRLSGVIFRS